LALRCVLDPWDISYYSLPFLFALVTWEALSFERPPVLTLAASLVAWLIFRETSSAALGLSLDLQALVFAIVSIPSIATLAAALYRPASDEDWPALTATRGRGTGAVARSRALARRGRLPAGPGYRCRRRGRAGGHPQRERRQRAGRRQRPAVALAIPGDRLLEAVLVGRRTPAELPLGPAVGEAPVQRRRPNLDRGRQGGGAEPPAVLASASATGTGSLIAGGPTPDRRPRSANSRVMVKFRLPRM